MEKKKIIIGVGILFLFIFCFAFRPVSAQAAELYLSPLSGSHSVGSNFAVSVYVLSSDQAINAVSGAISFPQNKLEIESLSKTGSIVSMWAQEPSFSNSDGTVSFEGIIPNPGFIGASGEIITINFKVKSIGSALITFSSGSVLANDGSGTDVLKSTQMAQFALPVAVPIVTPTPVPKKNNVQPIQTKSAPTVSLPPTPQISSLTHPDSDKWYNNNNPKFVWQLTPDIIAVRALFDKYPNSKPTIIYKPAISERDITTNLKDGIYYFHLQLENSAGWGPVSNFRFQIDTEPPEPFGIKFVDDAGADNPRPVISFSTTDDLSGVDYYKIKINNGDFAAIPREQIINNFYVLPLQTSGPKQILVMALDKAGNYAVAYVEFIVKSITPPVITDYPQKLRNNETLTIKGNSYPDSKIIIWYQGENQEAESWTATSDDQGLFTFTTNEKLENGVNKIWAQVIDKRGAKSDDGDKVTVVEQESIFFEIKSWVTDNIILVFLCVFSLFLFILLLVIYLYTRKTKIPKKVYKA